jgi:type IV secretory pathway TrbL component
MTGAGAGVVTGAGAADTAGAEVGAARAGAFARRSKIAVRDCICSCWVWRSASRAGSDVGGWVAAVGAVGGLAGLGGVAVDSASTCSSCMPLERVVVAMDRRNLIPDVEIRREGSNRKKEAEKVGES